MAITEEIPFHPAADIFPLLQGDDYEALKADIATHGQLEPIWVIDEPPPPHDCRPEKISTDPAGSVWYCDCCGENFARLNRLILDGRNRYRACVDLGIEPWFDFYAGDDPVAFVISLNLHRRHLSERQRAMVADRVATLRQGARTDLTPIGGMSQTDAAALLNVGVRNVQRAHVVNTKGTPELAALVDADRVSVSAAADVAELPQDEQREIVARGEKEILAAAKRIRQERNHRAQGTGENEWYTPSEYIEAARTALGSIDLDPASSAVAQQVVRAAKFYTEEEDGLTQPWEGNIWLNPPYSQPAIMQFAERMVDAAKRGVSGIMLTHNYTDTRWFHLAASEADAICFTRGRIGFISPEGERAAPTQGQAFFYYGRDVDSFADAFQPFGLIVVPLK